MSQRVKALEEQLRFKIFQRHKNAVSLTREGEDFVLQVRAALDRIVAAGIGLLGDDEEQVLKISVLPTFAIRWLFHRMPRFQELHPAIHLHIEASYNEVDFHGSDDIDLEIRYGDGRFAGVHSELLFKEDLTPVCSAELFRRVLGDKPVSEVVPDDLRHFTLLHSRTSTGNWKSWLKFAGASFEFGRAKKISFDTCSLSLEAASAGLGFAITDRAYVYKEIASGKLIVPFPATQPNHMGWHLVCREANLSWPQMQAFRSWLVDEARQTEHELALQRRNRGVSS